MVKKVAATLICTLFALSMLPNAGINKPVLAAETDDYTVDWSQFEAGDRIEITQTVNDDIPPVKTPLGETRTLYTLKTDENLIIGSALSTPALKPADSSDVAVVEGIDGTAALALLNRANNYDGVDIMRDALKINNMFLAGTYTLVVKGHVAPGEPVSSAAFVLGMNASPWRELTSRITPASDGSFELTYTKEYANAMDLATLNYDFRVQSPPGILTPFYIDNIIITADGITEPEITELLTFPFNNEAEQSHLFTVGGAGSSTLSWVSASGLGKDSDTALKVTHIADKSYVSADNAVRLTLDNPLPAGGTYIISAWVYAPAEENQDKSTLTGPGIVLNMDYAGKTGVSKFPVDFGTLPLGEWKELNIMLPLQETPLKTIDFRLVTDSPEKQADVWYLDNIVISQVGEINTRSLPKWDLTLGSIAKAYEKFFLMGNVMEPNQTIEEETTAMFKHHYNVVTCENVMKPVNLSKAKGVYNFTNADMIVNWAENNGIMVHGHTLVWHSQSAPWLTTDADGNVLTRAQAKSNMEEYINTVAEHFKGKVISWDVVNEVFLPGVSNVPTDWREPLRKYEASEGSPWYQAYENGADKSKGESGADYIYDAFVLARLADPGATLYYNDYNETMAGKREAIALMVEELNANWKNDTRNTEPDRLLIEGIGMQAHYWTSDLLASDVDASLARFVKTGVEISVSELDIPFGNWMNYKQRTAAPTEEEALLQADLYKQVFEVYKKYYKNISRVTFWGKADPQSWRGEGYPSLFDETFAPKAAYWSVMEVAKNQGTQTPSGGGTKSSGSQSSIKPKESQDNVVPTKEQDNVESVKNQDNIELAKGQDNVPVIETPKTGDVESILMALVLLTLSCTTLAVIWLKRRMYNRL